MIKQETLPPLTISTGDYDRLAFLASFGLNSRQDRPAAAVKRTEELTPALPHVECYR